MKKYCPQCRSFMLENTLVTCPSCNTFLIRKCCASCPGCKNSKRKDSRSE